jgi:hypothetical protein
MLRLESRELFCWCVQKYSTFLVLIFGPVMYVKHEALHCALQLEHIRVAATNESLCIKFFLHFYFLAPME